MVGVTRIAPFCRSPNRSAGWPHPSSSISPGFGASPPPPAVWGTADYADAMAEWIATLPAGRRVWIGHSFGCRVGLQLAARHPDSVHGIVLIAAAGLPPRRSPAARMRIAARRWAFRLA